LAARRPSSSVTVNSTSVGSVDCGVYGLGG
jgi:hypothetical protein